MTSRCRAMHRHTMRRDERFDLPLSTEEIIMTTNDITITVRTVGQAFGCEGVVTRGRDTLHVTRLYPYGQRANAYAAAEQWALDQGRLHVVKCLRAVR